MDRGDSGQGLRGLWSGAEGAVVMDRGDSGQRLRGPWSWTERAMVMGAGTAQWLECRTRD